MYVFVAVFCQGSDRLAVASLKHHAERCNSDCMFSSQSFVQAQIDSQLPASNTMGKKIPPTEMPRKMLELKLLCQGDNPGRAVTPADIKAAPGKLRGQAMISMMRSLSEEQKINYNKCNNERARHIWVAEYMLDPAKVKCYGIQGSNVLEEMTKKARRSELLEGIAVAKKRLSMAVCCCQRCAEIRMKSNQVTLIDAQLDNLSETEANKRAIECEKESIGRNVRVNAEKA